MKILVLITILLMSNVAISQEDLDSNVKVIHKYKKYEKFDFEDISIEAGAGAPGSISVDQRFQTKFENKLPYRKNFNPEIRKGIERVR
jgi:hypothetical protein